MRVKWSFEARTIEQLIGARVLQGFGASMLNPVALSIIANAFPDAKGRGRAVGIWGAVAGVSLGIGPLIGGALTQTLGWPSIFWINIPIGIASTSRQVGAALGVAISGTVVAASRASGTDFTTATHGIWWAMTACGALVLALGFAANTGWARASTGRVAGLLQENV